MLIKSQAFSLPSKREMCKSKTEIEVVIIDVAETEIEQPKKKQKQYYSGKQKCHTLKMQRLINQRTLEIICAAIRKEKEHDFRIFKKSKIKTVPKIEVIADKGYQGIKNYNKRSKSPHKKPRNCKLNPEQKREKRRLAQVRIKVEHIIRFLNIFRIVSSRYRNRRKRFGLRVNLIAGIYNYELKISRLS
jgi:hypothetical protein